MNVRKWRFGFIGFLNPYNISLTVILCAHSNSTHVLDFHSTEMLHIYLRILSNKLAWFGQVLVIKRTGTDMQGWRKFKG
jgi:hypothetical protein